MSENYSAVTPLDTTATDLARIEGKLDSLLAKVTKFENAVNEMEQMFTPDKIGELLTSLLGGGF